MSKETQPLVRLWLGLLAACISLSPIVLVLASNWHDQQRLLQLALLTTSAVLLLWRSRSIVGNGEVLKLSYPVVAFLGLGILSAAGTQHSAAWAWLEVSWFALHLVLFVCIADLAARDAAQTERFASVVLLAFAVLYATGTTASLVSVYMEGVPLSSRELIHGFSNSRFFGQFSTVIYPILVAFAVGAPSKAGRVLLVACASFMVFAMLISQTRGTFYGLVAALCVLLFARPNIKLLLGFGLSVACGSLLYVMLIVVPSYMAWIDASGLELRFDNFGLSGRGLLWAEALAMVQTAPWLGAGPMGFAALHHRLGAHPHGSVFQIASEWGVPALVLASYVVIRGMWSLLHAVRRSARDYLDQGLLVALTGSLIQSLVDGVLVMPLSQTALVATAAWAYSRVALRQCRGGTGRQELHIRLAQGGVLLILISTLVAFCRTSELEGNGLFDRARCQEWTSHLMKPRFWECGWIGPPPS